MTGTPKGPSRRERPAKPALTREGVVQAAVAILEQEGLGKVTMRRIATALDTGPASLYVYVRNTEDLHAQVLDTLLGRAARPRGRSSWRQQLHTLLFGYAQVLFDHAEIARMTMTTRPVGPHYTTLVESILELLHKGGVPDDRAAWGVDLLLSMVSATAVEHGSTSDDQDAEMLSTLAEYIAGAPEETYPRIAQLGPELVSGTGIQRFHWALDVLLNGFLATARTGG